jgi:transcriptional regulator with XRE-family HTH domain
MILGDKIRQIRELQNLSQGDIEARSGLLRCYISRVENGYTVPSVETLEKIASALGLPVYRLFCEDSDPPPRAIKNLSNGAPDWTRNTTGRKDFAKLRRNLSRLTDHHRAILLSLAKQISRGH